MNIEIYKPTGEATAYDKKQMLEVRQSKSWLKRLSTFANGESDTLIFGISDDDKVLWPTDAEGDAEKISEEIKNRLNPVPTVKLELKETDGKKLVVLHVHSEQEAPYYYIGNKQLQAFVLHTRFVAVTNYIQLKSLVLTDSSRTYDSLPFS